MATVTGCPVARSTMAMTSRNEEVHAPEMLKTDPGWSPRRRRPRSLDDIVDVGESAGLRSVAVDRERFPARVARIRRWIAIPVAGADRRR